MNNVYIVISVKMGMELEVCEVYSDLQVALGRGSAIAHFAAVHHPDWLQMPKDKGLDVEDTRRWIFLNNYSNYVAVHSKKIPDVSGPKLGVIDPPKNVSASTIDKVSDLQNMYSTRVTHLTLDELRAVVFQIPQLVTTFQWAQNHYHHCVICKRMVDDERLENPLVELLTSKDLDDKVVSLPLPVPTPPTPPTPKDDPMDPSLPVGWSYSGKPITMADLLSDPYNVSSIYSLSEQKQWALVTSRVKKRPGFTVHLPSIGTFIQTSALHELENKTTLGHEIVMLECVFLDRVLSEQKDEEDEESSSSESSEDC